MEKSENCVGIGILYLKGNQECCLSLFSFVRVSMGFTD